MVFIAPNVRKYTVTFEIKRMSRMQFIRAVADPAVGRGLECTIAIIFAEF